MRDENGLFLGNEDCLHLQGIDRVETRTCCGGRVKKYAYVKCGKRGVVLAETVCVSGCSERLYAEMGVRR